MSSKPTDLHPAVAEGLISLGAWSLIEDSFSPFAKETLTKVVNFVMVSGVGFVVDSNMVQGLMRYWMNSCAE